MIAENVDNLRRRIADSCRQAGRDPGEITLVAVAKTFPPQAVREAVAAGVTDIGENYAREFLAKRKALEGPDAGAIRWHFVGHLQSNKVRNIVPAADLIQAVDSLSLGEEIARRARTAGKPARVLVEVNTSGEESKFGATPAGAIDLALALGRLEGVVVEGLMTIGPLAGDAALTRNAFRTLRECAEKLRRRGIDARILSMGMTGDFDIAIAEGSTMLRIGTAIFGTREQRTA